MFKCTGANVAEIGPSKKPIYTVVLTPTEGDQEAIRIVGQANTLAATFVYGKTYTIAEATAPAEPETPAS